MSSRSAPRPTVMGEADRFARTVAPASASSVAGVTGTHMSSQISMPMVRPGTSSADRRTWPKGTHAGPPLNSSTPPHGTSMRSQARGGMVTKWRFS